MTAILWSAFSVVACRHRPSRISRLEPLQLDHVAVLAAARPSARRGCRSRRSAPSSRTRIRSAWRMVLRRWAITNEVRPLQQGGEALLDQPLALGVEVAGGLVEDEDPRVGQHGAGDGQPLALAAAQAHAALADQGVVAVGQPVDELGGVGGLGGVCDPGRGSPSGRRRRCSRRSCRRRGRRPARRCPAAGGSSRPRSRGGSSRRAGSTPVVGS